MENNIWFANTGFVLVSADNEERTSKTSSQTNFTATNAAGFIQVSTQPLNCDVEKENAEIEDKVLKKNYSALLKPVLNEF